MLIHMQVHLFASELLIYWFWIHTWSVLLDALHWRIWFLEYFRLMPNFSKVCVIDVWNGFQKFDAVCIIAMYSKVKYKSISLHNEEHMTAAIDKIKLAQVYPLFVLISCHVLCLRTMGFRDFSLFYYDCKLLSCPLLCFKHGMISFCMKCAEKSIMPLTNITRVLHQRWGARTKKQKPHRPLENVSSPCNDMEALQ